MEKQLSWKQEMSRAMKLGIESRPPIQQTGVTAMSRTAISLRAAVLFIGGKDDQEAVMKLTVIRSYWRPPATGRRLNSLLMVGMNNWEECPELSPIGDILSALDFSVPTSVLLIQQHNLKRELEGL